MATGLLETGKIFLGLDRITSSVEYVEDELMTSLKITNNTGVKVHNAVLRAILSQLQWFHKKIDGLMRFVVCDISAAKKSRYNWRGKL